MKATRDIYLLYIVTIILLTAACGRNGWRDSANRRMRTAYETGQKHFEKGEFPQALSYYYQADEAADTTDGDCDYGTLSRVHGQIARIFIRQGAPNNALKELRLVAKYADRAGDTTMLTAQLEESANAYILLNHTDTVLPLRVKASEMYARKGQIAASADALCPAISVLLENQENDKAKRYIDLYEKMAGRMDSSGYVLVTAKRFDCIKGTYYLNTGREDSAEYYFRKEIAASATAQDFMDGYTGLYRLYDRQGQKDSLAKYARLSAEMNKAYYRELSAESSQLVQTVYDYTHSEQVAAQKTQEAARAEKAILLIVLGVLVLFACVYGYIRHEREEREENWNRYRQSMAIIKQAKTDIMMLQAEGSEKQQLIAEKESVIEQQKKALETAARKIHLSDKNERQLLASDLYGRLSSCAAKGIAASPADLQELRHAVTETFPKFHDFMTTHQQQLNISEQNTCLLTRLHFKPSDIAHLLDISPSYVTKIRMDLNRKLFHEEGSAKTFDKRIAEFY